MSDVVGRFRDNTGPNKILLPMNGSELEDMSVCGRDMHDVYMQTHVPQVQWYTLLYTTLYTLLYKIFHVLLRTIAALNNIE